MVLILYISGADIGFVSLDPAANDSFFAPCASATGN